MKSNELRQQSGVISNEVAGVAPLAEETAITPVSSGTMATVEAPRPRKRGGLLVALALSIVVAGTAVAIAVVEQPAPVFVPVQPDTPLMREELLTDWVNRGYIPAQALDPAPASEEMKARMMRDLVNRGLVPRQALD